MPAPDALREWRAAPARFVRDVFRCNTIYDWQKDALAAFASPDPRDLRIAMQAPVGVGKDAVMAWCGWNFISCYGGLTHHPQGVCVGPTGDQLQDTLVKEYARWYNEPSAEWLRREFSMTTERIASRRYPKTWFISFRSYPKDADPETAGATLSGVHAPFVLIQFAESATMPQALCNKAEQARSGFTKWWKFMQAFNPIVRDGAGGVAAFEERERWRLFEITGDPDDPKRCPAIPLEMAREEIRLKGRDDPWVMAHILGQFPPGGLSNLFDANEVEAAMKRVLRPSDYEWAARIIGVDVAREGLDNSVVAKRQGRVVFPLWKKHGIDGPEGAGHVAWTWNQWDADACFVDATGGYGGSWIDQLRLLGRHPIGVQFAGEPQDRQYLNKRAEMYWAFAAWVKEGGALPDDPMLAKQLKAIRKGYRGDKLKVEDKEEIRKRIKVPLDEADSIACTFCQPVHPRGRMADVRTRYDLDGPQLAVMDDRPPWAEALR